MKAALIEQFGSIDDVTIKEIDAPQPLEGEVQICVNSIGVNPVDWKIVSGHLKDLLPHQFPLILGWDVSGIVTQVNGDVHGLKIEDEVYAYCRKPTVQWGTYAETVCFDAEHISLKPINLSFSEAAAIPLVALTAWQMLFDVGEMQKGQTVLVHAGAGGTGSMAIQFATQHGATVFTTASKKNHEYVEELGASVAIDYTKDDFREVMKSFCPDGVDIVLDCVGGETLENSYDCVKKGGILISIVGGIDKEKTEARGIRGGTVFVRPDGNQLREIKVLIESGKVVPPSITEMPFDQVHAALKQVQTQRTQGKIVLNT
jgi:NADPH:quinone reductase-like Zn-dependent oxidoreductase